MKDVQWDQLEEMFKGIAGVIDKGAKYFWPILVRLEVALGVVYLIMAIVTPITCLLIFRYIKKVSLEAVDKKEFDADTTKSGLLIVGVVGWFISLASFFGFLWAGLLRVIAPEIFAIQYIVTLLQGSN